MLFRTGSLLAASSEFYPCAWARFLGAGISSGYEHLLLCRHPGSQEAVSLFPGLDPLHDEHPDRDLGLRFGLSGGPAGEVT